MACLLGLLLQELLNSFRVTKDSEALRAQDHHLLGFT